MTRKPPLGSQVLRKEFFPATAMPDKSWWSVLWPNPDSTVRTLGIKAEMTVVDLCCGDGHFTAALAELVNGKVYPTFLTGLAQSTHKGQILDVFSAVYRKLVDEWSKTDCIWLFWLASPVLQKALNQTEHFNSCSGPE